MTNTTAISATLIFCSRYAAKNTFFDPARGLKAAAGGLVALRAAASIIIRPVFVYAFVVVMEEV